MRNAVLLLVLDGDGQRHAVHARLLTSSFASPQLWQMVLVWVNGLLPGKRVKIEIG
jgi:hypothetical protein